MRRLLFIAVAGVLFTSCSKEYRCQCVNVNETKEFPMAVSRKVDANNKCLQYQRQYNANLASTATNYTCTVK